MDAITAIFSGYVPAMLTPTLRDENSGILILLFLGLCQLIAVSNVLPAKVLITKILTDVASASKTHKTTAHKSKIKNMMR